ncbi:hypothetical protein BofuT4_uP044750.1 [Botrytis cinerea T4]|uniref:Uncharacterized protein n=1 Tax=Botryotinia fuckeliana (strain T4) TaxID=999810 RepID=G2XYC0_BOTF4|nr:hypothetical protein BofuT4_uP044750.1 [Botrytis cinerea T4]
MSKVVKSSWCGVYSDAPSPLHEPNIVRYHHIIPYQTTPYLGRIHRIESIEPFLCIVKPNQPSSGELPEEVAI